MRAFTRTGRASYSVLFAGSLILLAVVFLPLWKPLFLAAVLAGATMRWQDGLTRRLRGRRRTSAALMLLALIGLVLIPLSVLATYLVQEAISLAQAASALFKSEGMEGFVALAPDRLEPFVRGQLAKAPKSFGALGARIAEQGAVAATAIRAALSATGTVLFELAMMLVAFYFLLVDGPRLIRWLRGISPMGQKVTAGIVEELRRTTTSVLSSTVVTAAVQSVLATIGYFIARVPAALVFGFLTFLAAFIPSVGTAAVAIPICAVLFLTGHFVAGGFLLAWSLLVTGTADNVLKPLLAKGGAGLHGAVVFFAMIGGLFAFGALGLLIGPAAVSLVVALVRIGIEEASERRRQRALAQPAPEPVPPPPAPEPSGQH